MDRSLVELLVDPVSAAPLALEVEAEGREGEILEGSLRSGEGERYEIRNGIARFVGVCDKGQAQTSATFGLKWRRRDSYDSPAMRGAFQDWMVKRYGFGELRAMQEFFASRSRVLDAGCGSGFSTCLWLTPAWRVRSATLVIGGDVSDAIDVARERIGETPLTQFVQSDLMSLPFGDPFDAIIAEGVLHHTPATQRALECLVRHLHPGGEVLFYVYRKKAPVREFTDDWVRERMSPLPPEEAWEALRPLTRLGQALAELKTEVEVPEDVPLLGIRAGRYDIQRLVYWSFAKMFWNDSLTFEENHHVNFDWYAPRYAHRHTEEEIRGWCDELALSVSHFDREESGFTVRALKG